MVFNILLFKMGQVYLHAFSIRRTALLTLQIECLVLPSSSHPLLRKILFNLHTIRFLQWLLFPHLDPECLYTVATSRRRRLRILNLLLRLPIKAVSAFEAALLEEGVLQQTDVQGRCPREVVLGLRTLVDKSIHLRMVVCFANCYRWGLAILPNIQSINKFINYNYNTNSSWCCGRTTRFHQYTTNNIFKT